MPKHLSQMVRQAPRTVTNFGQLVDEAVSQAARTPAPQQQAPYEPSDGEVLARMTDREIPKAAKDVAARAKANNAAARNNNIALPKPVAVTAGRNDE